MSIEDCKDEVRENEWKYEKEVAIVVQGQVVLGMVVVAKGDVDVYVEDEQVGTGKVDREQWEVLQVVGDWVVAGTARGKF